MYVKTFRYRVLPSQMDHFRDVQRRVAELYEEEFGQDAIYLQNTRDPNEWLEIHIYADEAACRQAADRLAALPQTEALWREFEATLDPGYPSVIESFEQYHWLTRPETDTTASGNDDEEKSSS